MLKRILTAAVPLSLFTGTAEGQQVKPEPAPAVEKPAPARVRNSFRPWRQACGSPTPCLPGKCSRGWYRPRARLSRRLVVFAMALRAYVRNLS